MWFFEELIVQTNNLALPYLELALLDGSTPVKIEVGFPITTVFKIFLKTKREFSAALHSDSRAMFSAKRIMHKIFIIG